MLLFMHIPKTAGTSLREQISRWWAPGAVLASYGNQLCRRNPDPEFLHSIRANAGQARVVIGHYGWGARELLGQPTAPYATMVRDPVARAVSFYSHAAREPRSRHFRLIQQGMGLKELILSHRAPELNNHYVRTLLGSDRWLLSLWPPDPQAPAGPIDQLFCQGGLEEAWERMRGNFCQVGRTERYTESMAALSSALGVDSPGKEERLNRRPEETAQVELDARTLAVVRHYNALDIELYHRVAQMWG